MVVYMTAVENQGSQGNSAAGDSTQRTEKPAEPAAPPPAPSGAEGSSGGEGKGSVTLPEMRIEGRVSGQHGADGGVGTGAGRGGGPAVAAGARGTLGATPSETAASVVAMRGRDALEAARSAAPNPFVGKSEYLGQPGKMLVEGLATGRILGELGPLLVEGRGAEAAAAGTGVQANKAAGDAFSASVGADLRATGHAAVPEITVRTSSGTRTRLDWAAKAPNGSVVCIECKASSTAPLTPNQARAFPEIAQTGATVVGKGKPPFEGGTVIPPIVVRIVRP